MRISAQAFGIPVLGVGLLLSSVPQALGQITLQKVGNPTWRPADLHIFSAPVGRPPNFAGFEQTRGGILPPPNHKACQSLGIGPGAPHQPPYTLEMERGLEDSCLEDKMTFRVAEFTLPNGVWFTWMVVPGPGSPTGSSPDFASGPIIPNSIFPFKFRGTLFRNGQVYDSAFGFDIPPLTPDLAGCPFNVDGHSHFPIFAAETKFFGPPGVDAEGRYEYRFQMRDKMGRGWNINGQFRVTNKKPQCQ
jgi:hypothetical protein